MKIEFGVEEMNAKIKELINQSYETVISSGGEGYLDFNKEKFAELIVKMCADYADMAQDADCEYLGDAVAEYMGYGDEEGVANWRAK